MWLMKANAIRQVRKQFKRIIGKKTLPVLVVSADDGRNLLCFFCRCLLYERELEFRWNMLNISQQKVMIELQQVCFQLIATNRFNKKHGGFNKLRRI